MRPEPKELFIEFERYSKMLEDVKFDPENLSYVAAEHKFAEKSRFVLNDSVDDGGDIVKNYVNRRQAEPKQLNIFRDENKSPTDNVCTSAFTRTSFDMMDLFVFRSWHDSRAPFRPDINHRRVKYASITSPSDDGGPSPLQVAMGGRTRDFDKTLIGLMFYELDTCDSCETIPDVESCEDGFPLYTMGQISTEDSSGLAVLLNIHGKLVSKAGLQKAVDYFGCGFQVQHDPPTAEEVAQFLSITQGTHCRTVEELNSFLRERNIPMRIPDTTPFTWAKTVMAYHYQKNCGLVAAAWEGGHRMYLQLALSQGFALSGSVPLSQTVRVPRKSTQGSWIYDGAYIPRSSPLFRDANVQILVPKEDVNPHEYNEAMKQYGKDLTEASRNVIRESLSTAFLKCIDALTAQINNEDGEAVKLLDGNRAAVCDEWKKQHQYVKFRITMFPIYWNIMATDMFVKSLLTHYANRCNPIIDAAKEAAASAPEGERKTELEYRLEYMKKQIQETFYDANPQRVSIKREMVTLENPWSTILFSDKRKLHCPDFFLTYLELLMFGLVTTDSVGVFTRYFGEGDFLQQREKRPTFIHTNEFLHMIIQVANGVTDLLTAHYQNKEHPTYADKFQQPPAQKKLQVLLTHNMILDIMNTVTKYGPDPVVPDSQYVSFATR
jgi:hypothetical protein